MADGHDPQAADMCDLLQPPPARRIDVLKSQLAALGDEYGPGVVAATARSMATEASILADVPELAAP
jgi:hypothetical protein